MDSYVSLPFCFYGGKIRYCFVVFVIRVTVLLLCSCLPMLLKTRIMDKLTADIKEKLIEILNLSDVKPDEIDENAQLVGGELGIDSIDVLEMVVMVEKDYEVVINNKEIGEKVFSTLKNLVEYIRENSPKLAS